MRITLNAQLLSRAWSYRSGGISRHISWLLAELARDPRGHAVEAWVPELPETGDPVAAGGVRFRVAGAVTGRPSVRIPWEQTVLPGMLMASRPDLFHGLAYALPLVWRGRSVVTVYDLTFLRVPGAFNRVNRLYLSTVTRLSARRARRVITISESTRRDVIRLLGVPPERVDVTYLAADSAYRPLPAEQVRAFRVTHDLPERFIFSVGTLEPRKNLRGLLEAYALMPAPRVPLYVAGAAGWRFTPIFQRVRELRLERDVRFLGFVPEAELPLWYNAARVFAFPSLYEGFGLPVLEALSCGTPVVTSNAASLPEVAGEAAAVLDPTDHPGLGAAMQRLVEDEDVHGTMRAAGLEQARRFSWRTMADETVQAYERAVAGG